MKYFLLLSALFFSFNIYSQASRQGSDKSKYDQDKLQVSNKRQNKIVSSQSGKSLLVSTKKNNKPVSLNQDKLIDHTRKTPKTWVIIRDALCVKCRESKTDCPDKEIKSSANEQTFTNQTNIHAAKANLIISTNAVHFDVVELEDIHLDIPAFKQFKNNMTDFTADGEHEFHRIIQKIGLYLGTNYEGKGVTLKITGSASQIPTSFDSDLPNNNINPDGSSIKGKTSIANNLKLAKARADELARKIIKVFPGINIITPKLAEIKLGETQWTKECQLNLNKSFHTNKAKLNEVYEPFQKDQWVKVESKEKASKTIKPESIRMHLVSTTPYLKTIRDGKEVDVKSVFIISKKTFDAIESNRTFDSVEKRDEFIEKLDLKIFAEVKKDITRWYLLSGKSEIEAFNIPEYDEKVYQLFQLGIVDKLDEQIIEDRIVSELTSKSN